MLMKEMEEKAFYVVTSERLQKEQDQTVILVCLNGLRLPWFKCYRTLKNFGVSWYEIQKWSRLRRSTYQFTVLTPLYTNFTTQLTLRVTFLMICREYHCLPRLFFAKNFDKVALHSFSFYFWHFVFAFVYFFFIKITKFEKVLLFQDGAP